MIARCILFIFIGICAACAQKIDDKRDSSSAAPRIISLDFCADQYVLKLADHAHITALSPDAGASFSYMRAAAKGFPSVRPRAEDILILKPDIVVRSYGGGPNITAMLERVGVQVIQIGYASDLSSVEEIILQTAQQLDADDRGKALVKTMQARFNTAPKSTKKNILYMTSKGATAGTNTIIDKLITQAGAENFQTQSGWGSLPLERLAREKPDIIAAAYFETSDIISDIWTPSRHPVARRALAQTPVINIPGAWTACSGWFLLDAVERMAQEVDGS